MASDHEVSPVVSRKLRVLFFAEPATLAHVARPVVLAGELAGREFDVMVATGEDFRWIVDQAKLPAIGMEAIGSKAYLAAVAAGRPVFPFEVLKRYVEEDLRLIKAYAPDVVVGDLRFSLAVSARLAGVRYLAVTNAYWSPFARARFEVPVHALTQGRGHTAVKHAFRLAWPLISAYHALPMHRLRKRYGFPSLGLDLRKVFSEGDKALFADVPSMVPIDRQPAPNRYAYLGPVVWSPPGILPPELTNEDDERPLVYLALGSSGDSALLYGIAEALLALGCRVAVSTGQARAVSLPRGVVSAPFFPGTDLAARATVVVCNGGSPGTHQALAKGTPVLGIPENLDQMLNMQFVVESGAGLALRADRLSARGVSAMVRRLLDEESFRQSAVRVSQEFARYACGDRLAAIISEHWQE